MVHKPTQSFFETLLERAWEIQRHRDQAVAKFAECTVDASPATLIENYITHHRVNYFNYTNKSKIDCAREPYHEALETREPSLVK